MHRDKTLGEYFAMLRRGLPIIVGTAVVCALVALAISAVQKKTYTAQAALAVADPNQALAVAGAGGGISTQTQVQLSLAHAPQVTRPQVVGAVRASLRSPLTSDALLRLVSVSVDPNSALIDITAQSRNANEAAAIADAFAQQDASLTTSQSRHQYAVQAAQLAKKLLNTSAAKNPTTKLLYETQLERLQTLASVATPVSVDSTARVPSSPSSPKPLRNTVAAILIGLLLGLSLVYGRETLGRRLRQPADVAEVLDHPIVGHIRGEALGQAASHSHGSLNGAVPLDAPDEEAFHVLRQNVRYLAADSVRTLLVTSAGAQEGKSTVAACLAAAMVASGQRTLLVECDLRRPVLARRLGLPEGPGLVDYLTGNAAPTDILRTVPSIHPSPNGNGSGDKPPVYVDQQKLVCITAGMSPPRPAELLVSDRFRRFLAEVSDAYDIVILDSAPLLSVADTLEIVPAVSGVLLCVRLRQTKREEVKAAQAALSRLPEHPLGVVLTGLRKTDTGYYGYYSGYYAHAPAGAQ